MHETVQLDVPAVCLDHPFLPVNGQQTARSLTVVAQDDLDLKRENTNTINWLRISAVKWFIVNTDRCIRLLYYSSFVCKNLDL